MSTVIGAEVIHTAFNDVIHWKKENCKVMKIWIFYCYCQNIPDNNLKRMFIWDTKYTSINKWLIGYFVLLLKSNRLYLFDVWARNGRLLCESLHANLFEKQVDKLSVRHFLLWDYVQFFSNFIDKAMARCLGCHQIALPIMFTTCF